MRYCDEYENIKDISFLYELRHSCNVFGSEYVSEITGMNWTRMNVLCGSDVHGSELISSFFEVPHCEFMTMIKDGEERNMERIQRMEEIAAKNDQLVRDLKVMRKRFARIGTNKSKRRLNKLAINNDIAKAVRIALEIEDKNISAKDSYGEYRDRIYNKKNELILELCDLFENKGWIYGIQDSDSPPTTHVIYFEIPCCEQISWHFSPDKNIEDFSEYNGEWDGKLNSTLGKLELMTIALLKLNN